MISSNKRIVIHTGPGKTGSSAIQAWLASNQAWLEKSGVFYPRHPLSKEQISSGNLSEVLTLANGGNWQVDKEKIDLLMLKFAKSGANILLLSSEFFFHNMVELKKLIPSAEFVAYIRNPVELLESNYNQGVKRHSLCHPFHPPASLGNFFWQYLTNVFDKLGHESVILRPYHFSLMQGGNIVSDLLAVLGLDIVVENRSVNPSFTFPALEFKRLLNHFELNDLQPSLDNVLQSFREGESSYSLMSAEAFAKLNAESCQNMQQFIERFKMLDLVPLLDVFKKAKQRLVLKQSINVAELEAVAEYVKEANHILYHQIKALVAANPNLVIDNPNLYRCFEVEPKGLTREQLMDEHLLHHINQFTVHESKPGKICYELSGYFQKCDDLENALKFAKGAHYFNPGNPQFKQRLNQLIIQKNNQCVPENVLVYEPTKFERLTYKLKSKFERAKR
ncbi:hypothetical protein L4F40_10365 [Vibrio paracholerae]|uniref:hypothetical protein n=1 Tax=Vibrio paracholerae TaxID=650003 RepID=UPI0020961819|nr:hypothetical protein [Vibrio paracholerae]MCO7016129.1 hypothetical protein [Vibrio paracholerae]